MKLSNLKLMTQISIVGFVGLSVLLIVAVVQITAGLSVNAAHERSTQSIEAAGHIERIHVNALEMRRREKDFLVHGGRPTRPCWTST